MSRSTSGADSLEATQRFSADTFNDGKLGAGERYAVTHESRARQAALVLEDMIVESPEGAITLTRDAGTQLRRSPRVRMDRERVSS